MPIDPFDPTLPQPLHNPHWPAREERFAPFARSSEHIRKLSKAGVEARKRLPRCEAVANSTGEQCKRNVAPGFDRCPYHLRREDARRYDEKLEIKQRAILESSGNVIIRSRALNSLKAIANRRLLRIWRSAHKGDALHPGSTINLSPADMALVDGWLRTRGVDIHGVNPGTGRPWSPRAIDRMRWAGWRREKTRRAGMLESITTNFDDAVESLKRHEKAWWGRHGHKFGEM